MKTIARVLMTLSWIALAIFLARTAVLSPQIDTGLSNPALRIELPPDKQAYFLAGLFAALLSTYIHGVVAWIDWWMERSQALLPLDSSLDTHWQPPEVKRLKAAIRSGNAEEARCCAVDSAFTFKDEQWLTPYELAELYGNPAVIAAVRAAYIRHLGNTPGAGLSRFAEGQRQG